MQDSAPVIDVAPLLARGEDPLETVIARASETLPGGSLTIIAPFDPVPLRQILSQMGFSSEARKYPGGWRIACLRDGAGTLRGDNPGDETCAGVPDAGAPVHRDVDGLHIDVRGMEAPLPMLAILRLISKAGPDDRIIVHHDRDPVFLYPELAELGWSAEMISSPPGEVRLSITRGL